ncbi:HD-GYP domain-containing protein [Niallia sp. Man26]|uniref:HD-GYP domain-containing protein n=1 Tax=Niallia sp. Man26 TaxID=2912824 RepID=UPI001EDC2D34|nr:HD-GYP domain-containing protein [Niallia sp. Man26]UPO87014.1 HD-GYP domain-containing protein [Niallia sp. Man26]
MRLVRTKYLSEGAILAKPIHNEQGNILVNNGVRLDKQLIDRLVQLGVAYLYIDDKLTDDIYPVAPISDRLKREAMQTIETSFKELKGSSSKEKSFIMEKSAPAFKQLIDKVLEELKGHQELFSIMSDVFLYDNYIFSHSLNVTLYSLALGMELKLPRKQLETLGLGAILHDVGKMDIPLEILLKPGKLTLDEFTEIKKHANAGFDMLRKVHNMPLIVAHCAYQHHERLNGSGYPRGITGEEIHLFGKVIAVADVFDAITSNRVYRQAMLPHEALEVLYTGIDTLFDAKIVEAFRNAIILYPNGVSVMLSSGEKGIVSRQNKGFNERPVIRVIEKNGTAIQPYDLDLKENLAITIIDCEALG